MVDCEIVLEEHKGRENQVGGKQRRIIKSFGYGINQISGNGKLFVIWVLLTTSRSENGP
jgi:hypothetical protein